MRHANHAGQKQQECLMCEVKIPCFSHSVFSKHRGRDLGSDQSLQACGIKDGDTLVVVRRVLSADGEIRVCE